VTTLVIDGDGRIWPWISPAIQKHLRGMGAAQYERYVVKNCGFVVFRWIGRSATIKLRPAIVHSRAYGALMYLAADMSPASVALSTFDDGWRHEVLGSVGAALTRITWLIKAAQTVPGEIFRRNRNLSDLAPTDRWRGIVSNWTPAPSWPQIQGLLDEASHLAAGRYSVFKRDADEGTFRFDEIGPGIPVWARLHYARAKGMRLQDGADHAFHKFCDSTYRDVCSANRPAIDEVDAVIAWPGFGPLRRRYRRLMLPYRDPANRHWMLSTTIEDPDIDLRASGH